MTAALSPSSTQSFPRLTIDISDALLAWLVGLIEEASQERLREIQNEILLIDGTAERPTVVFSKKTEPKAQITEGHLFFEFGSEENAIKEGLGAILSLLNTEERDQLMQAIIRTNRAKALKR